MSEPVENSERDAVVASIYTEELSEAESEAVSERARGVASKYAGLFQRLADA